VKRIGAAFAIGWLCAALGARAEDAPIDVAPPRRDAAAMQVADVVACMRRNVVDRGALRDVELATSDAAGSARTLKLKFFWKPSPDGVEDRMALRVAAPGDLAGAAYLVVSRPETEDVYAFVPGVDRVQRVAGASDGRKLLGTDFTYAELRQLQGLLQQGSTSRSADAKIGDRSVFVLQTETDPETTGHRRIDSYVDQASCTLLRADLFGKGPSPQKVLDADVSTLIDVQLEEGDPFWLVLGYRMRDLTTGTATQVRLSDVFLLERLPEDLFAPASFHRVPLPEP
jgi:hypothetical protein